ncbi:hypothetical protein NPIL_459451, partial [Nephila pilipes]
QNEFSESISLHTSKLFLLNNNLLSDVEDQSRGGSAFDGLARAGDEITGGLL